VKSAAGPVGLVARHEAARRAARIEELESQLKMLIKSIDQLRGDVVRLDTVIIGRRRWRPVTLVLTSALTDD
jgi:hypothetical protein